MLCRDGAAPGGNLRDRPARHTASAVGHYQRPEQARPPPRGPGPPTQPPSTAVSLLRGCRLLSEEPRPALLVAMAGNER